MSDLRCNMLNIAKFYYLPVKYKTFVKNRVILQLTQQSIKLNLITALITQFDV